MTGLGITSLRQRLTGRLIPGATVMTPPRTNTELVGMTRAPYLVTAPFRRVRSQTGYPVPALVAETVLAGHVAHILFLDLFATVRPGLRRWVLWCQFQGFHWQVWEQLLQALDVAERARRREDPAAWVCRMVEVEDLVGELSQAYLRVIGQSQDESGTAPRTEG